MNAVKRAFLVIALGTVASAAVAQDSGYNGSQFVEAVQKQDSNKAMELLQGNPILVNARDLNGMTALIAAIQNRDIQWTGYLLQQGADPNMALKTGETPLIAASRVGLQQASEWLLGLGARVDDSNKMGETALIVAVQQRQVPIVRLLLQAGADPDKADTAAGYSARDYAKRETRTPELLRLIEAQGKKTQP